MNIINNPLLRYSIKYDRIGKCVLHSQYYWDQQFYFIEVDNLTDLVYYLVYFGYTLKKGNIMKISKELIKKYCDEVEKGNTTEGSCMICRITSQSARNWREIGNRIIELAGDGEPQPKTEYEELCVQFVVGEAEAEGKVMSRAISVIENAWEKHWQAAAWYLERRYPHLFGRYGRPLTELKDEVAATPQISPEDVVSARDRVRQRHGMTE